MTDVPPPFCAISPEGAIYAAGCAHRVSDYFFRKTTYPLAMRREAAFSMASGS